MKEQAVTVGVVDELLPLKGHGVGVPCGCAWPAIAGSWEGREIGGKTAREQYEVASSSLVLWAFACSRSLSFYRSGLAVHRKLRNIELP